MLSKRINSLEIESSFEVLKRAEKLSKEGKKIINLGIGQPDVLPPKNVINKAISTLNGENHGYTSSKGLYDLRDIIKTNTNRLYETKIKIDYVLNDELSTLLMTSGSTGSPEFVRLSHANIYSNTKSICEYLKCFG